MKKSLLRIGQGSVKIEEQYILAAISVNVANCHISSFAFSRQKVQHVLQSFEILSSPQQEATLRMITGHEYFLSGRRLARIGKDRVFE